MINKDEMEVTVKEASDILENAARELLGIDYNPSDIYCGIGKDVNERANWHKTKNLRYIETNSRDFAGAIEKEMQKRGFNTGKRPYNGGTEESVFVYIYPITPYTRETSE